MVFLGTRKGAEVVFRALWLTGRWAANGSGVGAWSCRRSGLGREGRFGRERLGRRLCPAIGVKRPPSDQAPRRDHALRRDRERATLPTPTPLVAARRQPSTSRCPVNRNAQKEPAQGLDRFSRPRRPARAANSTVPSGSACWATQMWYVRHPPVGNGKCDLPGRAHGDAPLARIGGALGVCRGARRMANSGRVGCSPQKMAAKRTVENFPPPRDGKLIAPCAARKPRRPPDQVSASLTVLSRTRQRPFSSQALGPRETVLDTHFQWSTTSSPCDILASGIDRPAGSRRP